MMHNETDFYCTHRAVSYYLNSFIMKKTHRFFLLHLLMLVAVTFSVFNTTSIVRAEDIPGKTAHTVCLKPTRCDDANAGCASYDTNPLIKVHRALLEFVSQVNSSQVYLQECIQVFDANDNPVGEPGCIPMPIQRNGSALTVRNYFADGTTSTKWNEPTHKEYFKEAAYEQCLASSTQPDNPLVIAACDNASSTLIGNTTPLSRFLSDKNYEFHGLYAQGDISNAGAKTQYPITANLGTKLEWGSSSSHLLHYFIATAYTNPIEGTSGDDPSSKVGQLGFPAGTPECEWVDYDPYGQVFDRETMQPVEGVRVALYRNVPLVATPNEPNYELFDQSVATQVMGPGYTLPSWYQPVVQTDARGYYSFVVPPGRYKVIVFEGARPTPGATGDFVIPVNATIFDTDATAFGESASARVNGTTQTLYPKVYQVAVSDDGLYAQIPPIDEGTTPERRDISVQNVRVADPKVVALKRDVNTQGDLIIQGAINKPFGTVSIMRRTGGQLLTIKSSQADKNGKFYVLIPFNQVPVGENLETSVAATDLEPVLPGPQVRGIMQWVNGILNMFNKEVNAQSTVSGPIIESRLNYLEGYAYDSSNKVIPSAQVIIMDQRTNTITYSISADENGFYRVPSDGLPSGGYDIYYQGASGTKPVIIDSQQFYEQNKEYLEMQNIDVRQPRYSEQAQAYLTQNPQRPNEPAVTGTQGTGEVQSTPVVQPPQQLPTNQSISPVLLMYVAILLLLVVGAGLLIMFYMKRKHEPHLYE